MSEELVEALLFAAPAELRGLVRPERGLALRLREALSIAVDAWAEVDVTLDEFARYLSARLRPDAEPSEPWAGLHLADLYLACGCAYGDAAARRGLRRTFGEEMQRSAARLHEVDANAEALAVEVEEALLGVESASPRIAHYDGRRPLRAFIRATVRRVHEGAASPPLGVDSMPTPRPHARAEGPAPAASREADALAEHLGPESRTAFRTAVDKVMAEVGARARSAAVDHFAHARQVDALAEGLGAPTAQVTRWLGDVCRRVSTRAREELIEQYGFTGGKLDAAAAAIDGRLDELLAARLRQTM